MITVEIKWDTFIISFIPDGSFVTMVERSGLPSIDVPGPRVTVVLQLPGQAPILWEPFAYGRVATMWSTILN